MSNWSLDSFQISDDSGLPSEPSEDEPERQIKDSAFTIIVDTREQQPFEFKDIIGDFRDAYAAINVKTVRKMVKPTGDYAILGVPGIAIERKSKSDLFQSLATTAKRDNLLERIRKMSVGLEFGAVIIECYPSEIYHDPPEFTDLNPRSVFRTTLSWAINFPLVHWYWCEDKIKASQTCYRILEKFYEHKINPRYRERNKLQDEILSAFKAGMIARQFASEFPVPYSKESELRVPWESGWNFLSSHFLGGELGTLYEIGYLSPSELKKTKPKSGSKPKKIAKNKGDLEVRTPLQDQLELPCINPVDDEDQKKWITEQFEDTLK